MAGTSPPSYSSLEKFSIFFPCRLAFCVHTATVKHLRNRADASCGVEWKKKVASEASHIKNQTSDTLAFRTEIDESSDWRRDAGLTYWRLRVHEARTPASSDRQRFTRPVR